jgi:AraC-like DNA-binding protein
LAISGERRARLSSNEHELGSWTRATRPPDARLTGLLSRELIGYRHDRLKFSSWLEPPRPELTLMIDLNGSIRADGMPLTDAWVGGLGDRPTVVGVDQSYSSIDIKLDPLGAYRLLGRPLSELARQNVSLGQVLGPDARDLAERLRSSSDWDHRFDLLEGFLLRRLERGPTVHPAVEWAWRQMRATGGRVRVQALAAELGCSRRYLHSRFREQVGVGPKTAARLLRFEYVRARIEHEPAHWADIAHAAGYADQSHLNREFRQFAGTTPGEFVARRIPDGGVVGDGSAPATA